MKIYSNVVTSYKLRGFKNSFKVQDIFRTQLFNHIGVVWIENIPAFAFAFLFLFLFFTRSMNTAASGSRALCMGPTPLSTSTHWPCYGTVNGSHALFMGPTNLTFQQFFIKNGSHSIIYTFKNYFVTVFSVFSFSDNKFNPNEPIVSKHKDGFSLFSLSWKFSRLARYSSK